MVHFSGVPSRDMRVVPEDSLPLSLAKVPRFMPGDLLTLIALKFKLILCPIAHERFRAEPCGCCTFVPCFEIRAFDCFQTCTFVSTKLVQFEILSFVLERKPTTLCGQTYNLSPSRVLPFGAVRYTPSGPPLSLEPSFTLHCSLSFISAHR